jgi:hypothetical protein
MQTWQRIGRGLVAIGALLTLAACSAASSDADVVPLQCGPEVETGPQVFVNVLPLHERVASVTGCVSGLPCKRQRPRPIAGPPKMRLTWFRYPFDPSAKEAVTGAHISIRVKTAAGSRFKRHLRLVIPSTKLHAPCSGRRIPGIAMVSVEAHRFSVVYAPTDDIRLLASRLAAATART